MIRIYTAFKPDDAKSPLHILEHALHPWVAFVVVPILGLANAGVSLATVSWGAAAGGTKAALGSARSRSSSDQPRVAPDLRSVMHDHPFQGGFLCVEQHVARFFMFQTPAGLPE